MLVICSWRTLMLCKFGMMLYGKMAGKNGHRKEFTFVQFDLEESAMTACALQVTSYSGGGGISPVAKKSPACTCWNTIGEAITFRADGKDLPVYDFIDRLVRKKSENYKGYKITSIFIRIEEVKNIMEVPQSSKSLDVIEQK